ncbi:lysine-specific demethylase 7B-like isoform X4 [Myxocyprinus asiaticus]|uniref:lysine-specific demethylase 7B-like isoform X4 n=1 Tax=Myxocyprinus asiaticus TaxID=70543 RepID=UPI0022219535|nr:lysine-specific demethylase 7B-like isoform X4 [Myxocyprinus asiaticus]
MAAAQLYCVCRQPYDVSRFMIECDICKDWFHGSCVAVEEHHAVDIDVYHCPNCDVLHGPSLMKKRNNWHRHDYTELDDGSKPVQAGTSVFVRELQARTFPSGDEILERMQGSQVTQQYLERHGFRYPIAVSKMEGLGLRLPPPDFSIKDVERYVGWIHAVLTSQDCMAFGGNFLHNLNIGMQLRCYEMERRLKTPDLFKFPYFEAICWYVAKNLLETLKESREENYLPPGYLIKGVKALITALRNWLKREFTEPASEVPDHIRPNHLIKMLTKEIHYLEEYKNGNCGSKQLKSQESLACPSTRSSHERGSHARRNARRLRDHHHHHHCNGPKVLSNLDIFEQHTQEVLKRLETGPYEEDASFNVKVNGKFNKVSTASAAMVERSLGSDLRLMLCNGRIIRDDRQHLGEKQVKINEKEGSRDPKRDSLKIKIVANEEEQEMDIHMKEEAQDKHSHVAREVKPLFFTVIDLHKRDRSDLRNRESEHSEVSSDSESEEEKYTTRKKNCSEEESESSSEEEEDESLSRRSGNDRNETKCSSSYMTDMHHSRQRFDGFEKCHKIESATSPSTEEDAIQGMLSMAGLLYSHQSEDPTSSQESWWSRTNHPSPDYKRKEVVSGEENQDSDSSSSMSNQEFREHKHSEGGCHAKLKHRIQEHMNFMDSQGSGSNSSSEAWSSRTHSPTNGDSPTMSYQYCETSLSPPLHPSKRPASNPPPISNQATKGKRPKKGMATAKQRLGKILKLSRHKPFFV